MKREERERKKEELGIRSSERYIKKGKDDKRERMIEREKKERKREVEGKKE